MIGGSLTVTNTIVVKPMNDAPVAGSASVNLVNGAEDTAYVIQTSDLLQGFSDVDGDSLSIINLSADNGSVVDNQDGTFTFTPDANYNSTVTLSYEVSDGQLGIAASQTLTLAPVNDAPEALVPVVDQTTDEGQVFSYQLPADAFIDVDSPNLSYSATLADGSALPSWLSFDANTQTFSGTPSFSDAGVLSVKVMASDGQLSAEQVLTLDVMERNQLPVIDPNASALMLDEDSTLVIEVLSRVVDFEGDALTVSNINVDAAQGTAVLNADQSITFTPTANFHGTVSLSYDVSDGDAQGRVLSVVESIVVNSVNDAPVAGSTSISLANGSEDTPYTLKASDLLQGFSDVDGDSG